MPGHLQEEFYLPVLAQLRAHKSSVEELSQSIPIPSSPHPWCFSSFPPTLQAAGWAAVPFLTALKATKASPACGLSGLAPQPCRCRQDPWNKVPMCPVV